MRLYLAAATAAFSCAIALDAAAEGLTLCGPTGAVAQAIIDAGQQPVGRGLPDTDGAPLAYMLFADPATGAWTILRANGAGWACVTGTGTDWQAAEPTTSPKAGGVE